MTDNENTTPVHKLANAAKPAGQAISDLRDIELINHDFTVEQLNAEDKGTRIKFDELNTWTEHIERIKAIVTQNDFKFIEKSDSQTRLDWNTQPYQKLKFRHKDYRTYLTVKTFLDGKMKVEFELDYRDKRGGNK